MPTTDDRLAMLRTRDDEFTGIDFVQIVDRCEQTRLRVFFLTDPRELDAPFEDLGDPTVVEALGEDDIRIYSPRGEAPDVPVLPPPASLVWVDDTVSGRRVLQLDVPEPGTFTDYRLRIEDDRIDRAFNDVRFSFKIGCDSRLDCATPLRDCAAEPIVDFDVDYLARDFVSLRNALVDFAAQRYPQWQLPREADVGMMLTEILAAVGDELGYVQERLHREAGFDEATERRTLRNKARLVDREIHDGRMASTLIELAVSPAVTFVEGGWPIWVRAAGHAPVAFEIGRGMQDRGVNFVVDPRWNAGNFTPYGFDDDDACLLPGATEVLVRNDPANPQNPGGVVLDVATAPLWKGRPLLLRRLPADPSETEQLFVVRVAEVTLEQDILFGIDLARIRWESADALTAPIELEQLQLSGNLVPATAGASRTAFFRIGPLQDDDVDDGVVQSIEREGPLYSTADPSLLRRRDRCLPLEPTSERPTIHRLSLPDTDAGGLAFADVDADLRRTIPEVEVHEVASVAAPPGLAWQFRRSLLVDGSDDRSFTIEDGTWRRIVGYPVPGGEHVHRDYATGAGYTLRLGDGEFGHLPADGTLLRVDYRLGAGARANVSPHAVRALAVPGQPPSPLAAAVSSASNPFPVTDGVDPESAAQIKLLTPHAYTAERFFAVRPEDYGEQAQKLEFVQRAQGHFRWTGTWLSAITTADPIGSFTLSADHRRRLEALLDCRRQAGRDVIVADPQFFDLDLRIVLCVARAAYPAHVQRAALEALFGRGGVRPRVGFFDPDHFTFGTPLRRSALEATLQRVPGVDAVVSIEFRRVGVTDFAGFTDFTIEVADDEVIRVRNDPARPEQGTVDLRFEGGA